MRRHPEADRAQHSADLQQRREQGVLPEDAGRLRAVHLRVRRGGAVRRGQSQGRLGLQEGHRHRRAGPQDHQPRPTGLGIELLRLLLRGTNRECANQRFSTTPPRHATSPNRPSTTPSPTSNILTRTSTKTPPPSCSLLGTISPSGPAKWMKIKMTTPD